MKKYFLLILFLLLFPFALRANEDVKNQIKADLISNMKLNNYQMGRKFIVAIPPNETASFGWSDSAIEIYVAGPHDTNLEMNILGSIKKERLRAGEVVVIDENMGLTKSVAEIRDIFTATNKTVTIEADAPVSVYVMNSKNTTTDGYMAIPVEHWGKEYLHCSYYDNFESSMNTFAGGFLVLGSEDNTSVIVDIRGVGSSDIATLKGRPESIGDQITFKIDEGEVYQVENDGLTRGEFDISGTKISSDKPIGIVSYHWRTVIPIFTPSSRDHLCAMIQPTNTLGKEYASISLERGGSKKGDLFRVMAVEDSTFYNIKWFDFETKELLGNITDTLVNAGDFNEHSDVLSASKEAKSITGTSIFKANKPIFLMQYSYSAAWDNSAFDPFMWPITATDQYVSNTIVQAPSNKSFAENYLCLIAKHDTNDTEKLGLKSITFDGTEIIYKIPSFISNQIPGTNLYWATFMISPGPHQLRSNGAKCGGYIYGFKSVDSYGWPAAMAFKPNDKVDTVAPKVEATLKKGSKPYWSISVEELTNGQEQNDVPRQVDTGIWGTPLTIIDDDFGLKSYNISEPQLDYEWTYKAHFDYQINLEVKNPKEKAKAYFYVVDYDGNITLDSVSYEPEKIILLNKQDTAFGKVFIDSSLTKTLVFNNESEQDVTLDDIFLHNDYVFTIESTNIPSKVKSGSSFSLEVKFDPTHRGQESDTLSIETEYLSFDFALTGQGVSNDEIIEFGGTEVLDFGTVFVNQSKELDVVVTNAGETKININHILMQNATVFSTSNEYDSSYLSPGDSISVTVKYAPTEVSQLDLDSVLVATDTRMYSYPVLGNADIDDYVMEDGGEFIKVSPNPIQSEANVTVNLTQASNLTAKLYGMEGQLITTLFDGMCNQGEKSIKLDASNLASGSYSLVIELGNKKYASQIVIAK